MKDYYKILEIAENATEIEIRKAYRRLALKYHPDHNPGNPDAEERFKEIAEAYGVLAYSSKRDRYDQAKRSGAYGRTQAGGGFSYTQEEIFRDLFRDPRFNQMFNDLFREFGQSGFRFDNQFLNRVFFDGRGGIFGGVFVWGPYGAGTRQDAGSQQRTPGKTAAKPAFTPSAFIRRLGRKVANRILHGVVRALPGGTATGSAAPLDITYDLPISREMANAGGWVQITIDRRDGQETLKVNIPPRVHNGTRLRLKGKGNRRGTEFGDLYVALAVRP